MWVRAGSMAVWLGALGAVAGCSDAPDPVPAPPIERQRVILDTDANNELDDQHAIAYALFNSDVFDVEAVTVNSTVFGDGIAGHLAEANRVVRLCDALRVPVLAGAEGNFEAIEPVLSTEGFDGQPAVDFIIDRARASDERRLTLLPIGKLTNVALALRKAPDIADRLRVVWLGSNWPAAGEYNLENDRASVNAVIRSGVELEIAVVRYGEASGTAAVAVSVQEIAGTMPGLGPSVDPPVPGRHGGEFSTFGDYSVELFRASGSAERALFDVAAVAVVKNGTWSATIQVAAPELSAGEWMAIPGNTRSVTFREAFDRDAILQDFFDTMRDYALP